MHLDHQVDPNILFMGYLEFMGRTGFNRNHVRSAILAKKINNVIVAGHPMFYRLDAERFIEALNAQKAKEAQYASA